MSTEDINCHCSTSDNTICTMKTAECCWCSDKRQVYKIYIDEYGMIEPNMHHYSMPRDLYYCSSCKRPDTISVGKFTEEFKNILPPPEIFHGRITKKIKNDKIQFNEHIMKKQERLIHELLKKGEYDKLRQERKAFSSWKH